MARARTDSSGNASELVGLVAFAIAALVAISLLSFDPLDRSFFTRPPTTRFATHNLAGAVGANLAHGLIESLGAFAYLMPIVLIIFGVRRLRKVEGWPQPQRIAGLVLLWFSMATLLAVTAHTLPFTGFDGGRSQEVLLPAGGHLGRVLAAPLARWVGPVGSLVVLLTTIVGSLILATPLSFARAFDRALLASLALFRSIGKWTLKVTRQAMKRIARQIAIRSERKERESRDLAEQRKKDARAAEVADQARLKREDNDRIKRERETAEQAAAARTKELAAAGAAAARGSSRRESPSPVAVSAETDRQRQRAALSAAPTLRLPDPTPTTSPATTPISAASDVAALAAAATGAMRKAREAKMAIGHDRRDRAKDVGAEAAEFAMPPITILEELDNDTVISEDELVENAKVLVAKLEEFAVTGTVQAIHPGPVVTTYEYRPEAGVKYSKIVGLGDDLCLAMKAEGVRIDRISGKSAVGIEVPNSARESISLRELLETDSFKKSSSKLTIALGKDLNGKPYMTDLRKMPHLLVAGATGAGKSVAVNCMIVSILYRAAPADVRFIMVDPKRIELGVYDAIPHLLVPVVTDARKASYALRWAVSEMENRYKRLANLGVRSLEQFNTQVKGPDRKRLLQTIAEEELEPLPYIVIIIDELADLMMVAASEVEDSISRLAAMARAVGIHLVLATQRPSVDVITGVIKANFPSRISFRVSSKVDSRTILDSNGAEMLLGKGDMLFMPPGSARLQRIHGGFISDEEVERLVKYLKAQAEPNYNQRVLTPTEETKDDGGFEMDDMYDESIRVVLETGQASVSMLQRRLRLGYGRAARLVDMMERNGIVGPSQGAKGREILVDREEYLAQLASARG